MRRHVAHLCERRVQAALREVGVGDLVRERARGRHEHLVGHAGRADGDRREPHAGEDVRVVALARHVRPAVQRDRVERAAAGEQRAPAAPSVRLLRRALGLRRRIGQRENDRPLVDARHVARPLPR